MKGLLALGVHMNKAFIIGAAISSIAAAILTGVCHLLLVEDVMYPILIPLMIVILLLMISTIAFEGLPKATEKYIKNRYLNYALSGVTVGTYNVTELLKNILFVVYSFALGGVYLLIIMAFGIEVAEVYFRVLICATLAPSLMAWILMPLTLLLKSSEKAALVFALPLGFAGGIAVAVMSESEEQVMFNIEEFLMNNTNFLIMIGVVAAVYLVVAIAQHFILKRGGIC